MRYRLQAKTIQSAPTNTGPAQNPAMQRQGTVPMDPGRPWAGDPYDEGPVTAPEEAFAHFTDPASGGEVEAWLDKAPDGTLIGWVRQGDDYFRYMDPDAWSADVDGAGMAAAGEPMTAEGIDPEAAADPDALAEADPEEVAAVAEGEPGEEGADESDDSIGALDPEAFDQESDRAVTEEDPTEGLEDPTELTEAEGDGGEEADDMFADLLGDQTMPDADPAAEADPAAAPAEDPAEETVTMSAADVDADLEGLESDTETDETEAEPADAPTDTDGEDTDGEGEDEDEEDEEEWRLKGKAPGAKHLPGEHNQETHGNRSGIRSAIGATRPGGGAAPKAGESPRAALNPVDVAAMPYEDLVAIVESDDFDSDTLMAAAVELDSRNDLDPVVRERVGDAAPGSPEEAAAFTSVIPDAWAHFAATGNQPSKGGPTKAEKIEAEWMDYYLNQIHRAEIDLRGHLTKPGVLDAMKRAQLTTYDFFNGTARARTRRFMSEELREWLDQNHVTKAEWLAEFYPSYAKRLRRLGSGESLSENG